MAITEFSSALNQVATERGIPVESVIDSIEEALKTAFKKDRAEHDEEIELEEIDIDLNQQTGEVAILKDGKDVTPSGFGRIAAQTAKQVILQKIRETEKDLIVNSDAVVTVSSPITTYLEKRYKEFELPLRTIYNGEFSIN